MGKINPIVYNVKNMNITIRTANPEDGEKIIELIKAIDEETTFLLREPGEFNMTLQKEKEFLSDKQEDPTGIFLMAEVEGSPIATCTLAGNSRKRLLHASNLAIAIKEQYCNLGIGRRMMETAIAWAKENNITRITLEVDTNNYRAISLYTKLGFEVEGTFKMDKKMSDGSYRNSYAMALLL